MNFKKSSQRVKNYQLRYKFSSYLANIYQCDDGERNRNLATEYKKIRNSINKVEMPLTYNLVSMLENGYKSDSKHDNEDYIFRTYFET